MICCYWHSTVLVMTLLCYSYSILLFFSLSLPLYSIDLLHQTCYEPQVTLPLLVLWCTVFLCMNECGTYDNNSLFSFKPIFSVTCIRKICSLTRTNHPYGLLGRVQQMFMTPIHWFSVMNSIDCMLFVRTSFPWIPARIFSWFQGGRSTLSNWNPFRNSSHSPRSLVASWTRPWESAYTNCNFHTAH